MGTNYYIHSKDKQFMTDHFSGEYEIVDIPDFGYEVHICKMSFGWRTLFQAHNMAYTSVKHMVEFFRENKNKFTVWDEYGGQQDLEEFIELCLTRDSIRERTDKHKFIWKKSAMSDLTKDDDATSDYIETPFDHIEYMDFEKKHGGGYGSFDHRDWYWNDDEGFNFMNGDFS